MKSYQIIIILISFVYIFSECLTFKTISNKTECSQTELSEQEKAIGFIKCCYYEYTSLINDNTNSICIGLYEDQYKKIKKFINKTEEEQEVEIHSIYCNSNYSRIGLILLIIYFIF